MQSDFPIPGPLSLGELLDRAFRLYRARFGSLVLLAAIFLIPLSILSGVLGGEMMLNTFQMYQDLLTNPDAVPTQAPFGALDEAQAVLYILLSTVGGFLVNGIVTLALTSHIVGTLNGTPVSLGQSVGQGLRRFMAYLGMSIVRAIALFGVYLGAGIVTVLIGFLIALAVVGGAGAFGPDAPDLGATGAIGLVLLIICGYGLIFAAVGGPVLYLLSRWLVVTPVLVDQRLGPFRSLGASWRLTKGNARRVFFYALLLGILYFVLFVLLSFTVQWVFLIVLGDLMPTAVAGALTGGFNGLLAVLWQPLFVAAIVLLYFDLRVRHESYDLSQRIDRMESAVAPSGSDPFMLTPDDSSRS